jgi:hypothetical protein
MGGGLPRMPGSITTMKGRPLLSYPPEHQPFVFDQIAD